MKKLLALMSLIFMTQISIAQHKSQVRQLDSIFTIMHHQNQFNGSILIAEKGKVLYNKGFGLSNEITKAKNTTNTVYELASCSKQFAAAAMVLLKRQGKINYEDKITKYLPALSHWHEVTLMDLIKHTSGLPEYLVEFPKHFPDDKIATNEDLIQFYASRKDTLQFAVGSLHRYNNTNYALIASIVEQVSGLKYADFLAENIFKPLKMKNTFVYNRRLAPRNIKNHAIGYVWATNSFEKMVYEAPKYNDLMTYKLDGIVGSAKVNSTTGDLLKWITALKNNTFFTAEEFELMTTISKTSAGKNIAYGFGLDVAKRDGVFSFGHTGSWDGYATFTYHNMLKDRTIIVLQNFKMGAYPYDNINEILDGKPLTVEYKKKINLPEKHIQQYVGNYTDEKGEIQMITYLDGYLVHNSSRVAWDMRFFPISDHEFQAVRQGGTDGVLQFTKQENGTMKLEMLQYGASMGSGIKQ